MEQPQYHLQSVVHAKESLEDFDGPLDVILLLLSKNKIEIQDVSISSILEQYLAWLDERKRMDMEVASEFIAMASHLMYIKTRMLLSEAEKAEAESEMQELIASLQQRQRKDAYEQIKTAGSGACASKRYWSWHVPQAARAFAPRPDLPLSARQAGFAGRARRDAGPVAAEAPTPGLEFCRHCRRGAVSGRKKSGGGSQTAHWARRDEIFVAFQGKPQPVGDRGDIFVGSGALPAPLGAH